MEERECVKNEGENMFALSRESEACFLICPPGVVLNNLHNVYCIHP